MAKLIWIQKLCKHFYFLSITYFVVVAIITSLVMVTVHDRVPDMQKYPPLPDIFLDNVPLIPW